MNKNERTIEPITKNEWRSINVEDEIAILRS